MKTYYSDWLPLKPTPVFSAYWYFACERQNIFWKKLNGSPQPWTEDPILQDHKFTNAYRLADRTSQYLIRNVIEKGEWSHQDLVFRIILFKLFNKIETWEYLEKTIGEICWANYDFACYSQTLQAARDTGQKIFSAAYIMPSGKSSFGYKAKHNNCLKLIELMMADNLARKLASCQTMAEGYALLKGYPMVGKFLAYQLATDINYSRLTNWSETEFVIAGGGAVDGISKCFENPDLLPPEIIIQKVQAQQEQEFARHGLTFHGIEGRPLQLIDCQNLFCEISKYARIAFPEIKGSSGRHRIKQKYSEAKETEPLILPAKWQREQVSV